jgi:hypothetical protein
MTSDIENLLRDMPLRKPPASLDAKVVGGGRRLRIILWTAAAAGVAAAAAAVIIMIMGPGGPARLPVLPPPIEVAQAAPPTEPVRLQQNWSRLSYEGVVVPDGRTPLRQVRHRVLEHVQWIDAAGGTRTEMTLPREEVILIKAPID